MAVIDPKCKMVSCRLSEVEYADAEAVSRAMGYRSLSSFARAAILAFTPRRMFAGDQVSAEQDLRLRVERLAAELKRFSERLGTTGDASTAASEEAESITFPP